MEFSFSLNILDKYLRTLRNKLSPAPFNYDGIVLYVDDSDDRNPIIGLCLYALDKAFNLNLLLPKSDSKKSSKGYSCHAEFETINRPNWDLVFFSKGDWERAMRMARKEEGEKKIVFKQAACFPQLGLNQDHTSGFSNVIMMVKKEIFSTTEPSHFDFSFGKPFPPIWKEEALSIAFRLIEHKLVTNQWLINLIAKIDAAQKKQSKSKYSYPKILFKKAAPLSKERLAKSDARAKKKMAPIEKKSTAANMDVIVSPSPKSSIKLKSKPDPIKKKIAKKKSKKQFKFNNLGFKM